MTGPRIAIVHDYLTQRGGAERVVLSMARAFPDAPVHTSLYDPGGTFPEFGSIDVRTSPLDRFATLRTHHVAAFPLLAPTFGRIRPDADVVICSSSGWAHGVGGDMPRIVYCYTPARWLYPPSGDLRQTASIGSVERVGLALLGPTLRRWDRRHGRRADLVLAISTVVAERIRRHWGVDPRVVPPPVLVDAGDDQTPVAGCEPGFWLCVSRLHTYKRVDRVCDAFRRLPGERLVVAGIGPDRTALERSAPTNVRFLGTLTDAELRWCYANCTALITAAEEDFGLTPLEAAAFGKPSVVPRAGGFLDTVIDGVTGLLLDRPDAESIAAGIETAAVTRWDPSVLRRQAARYDESGFVDRLRSAVDEVC